jgi:hypothetical protein
MYQGYPFDRLRRRLGLEPVDPASIDPGDLSCAGAAELKALAPADLDDHQLVEAFLSAAGLRDDAIAAPLAEELLNRRPEGLRRVAADELCAGLVRRAMQGRRPESALDWIDRARPLGAPEQQRRLDVWRAEILARAGRPEEAAGVYKELAASAAGGDRARLALDAAETLLDNDHAEAARGFLRDAVQSAGPHGLRGVGLRAERLLNATGRTA